MQFFFSFEQRFLFFSWKGQHAQKHTFARAREREEERMSGIDQEAALERLFIKDRGETVRADDKMEGSGTPTKLWTGLVLHHKDVFVSHVISKLNTTDRWFFALVNRESWDVLAYAGVDVSKLCCAIYECTSISTLELVWNHTRWGEKSKSGTVMDQAWFCGQVATTNKIELLKWAREVKQCEWDEETINVAAREGNLEMLKYCFSNDCPCDEKKACKHAAAGGNLDCLRFLFDKVEPSRDTEREAAIQATCGGHVDILKYFVEERKISEEVKIGCVANAAMYGHLDCLKYLFGEEAKAPLNYWRYIANARYHEHPECENYLLERGCPEPTDEEYARFVD